MNKEAIERITNALVEDDERLADIKSIVDYLEEIESKIVELTQALEIANSEKQNALEAHEQMKKKYVERFMNEPRETKEKGDERIEKKDEESITYEDVFKKEGEN